MNIPKVIDPRSFTKELRSETAKKRGADLITILSKTIKVPLHILLEKETSSNVRFSFLYDKSRKITFAELTQFNLRFELYVNSAELGIYNHIGRDYLSLSVDLDIKPNTESFVVSDCSVIRCAEKYNMEICDQDNTGEKVSLREVLDTKEGKNDKNNMDYSQEFRFGNVRGFIPYSKKSKIEEER